MLVLADCILAAITCSDNMSGRRATVGTEDMLLGPETSRQEMAKDVKNYKSFGLEVVESKVRQNRMVQLLNQLDLHLLNLGWRLQRASQLEVKAPAVRSHPLVPFLPGHALTCVHFVPAYNAQPFDPTTHKTRMGWLYQIISGAGETHEYRPASKSWIHDRITAECLSQRRGR